MHQDSMAVTAVGCMGACPGLLLWESRAVTAGNSLSPGQCFPAICQPERGAAVMLAGHTSGCAPPLTPPPALGLICTLLRDSDTLRRRVALGQLLRPCVRNGQVISFGPEMEKSFKQRMKHQEAPTHHYSHPSDIPVWLSIGARLSGHPQILVTYQILQSSLLHYKGSLGFGD